MELLFLFGFSLHNLEEGLWLPEWSKTAGKYHKPIEKNEFLFALIVITAIGHLLTFLYFILGGELPVFAYIYCGFIGMMILNSVFPHLIATIALRKYSPGLITGILLNIPIGIVILSGMLRTGLRIEFIALSILLVGSMFLGSLNILFRIGKRLIK